ncbi:hypothetical protein CIW49_28120 [Mycolicibacterium sp. P1-18]|uniref:hypothetical protein n=1 Tax=Mycolicibacterium sp. P1-18 TaxID=2024615 RepID=UPI0011F399EC|nr:hypothetical protein [Mycolicibacterium sp. P1-18]KAA0092673.1 hypothetical protein CIW49_28120 [Mycolicibacterium sp. P1-18]
MDAVPQRVEVVEVVGHHLDEGSGDVAAVEADSAQERAVRRLDDAVGVVRRPHPGQRHVVGEQPDVGRIVDLGELGVQPVRHEVRAPRAEEVVRKLPVRAE